eukprot:3397071-Pleurochrysis_carterae.AAC.1
MGRRRLSCPRIPLRVLQGRSAGARRAGSTHATGGSRRRWRQMERVRVRVDIVAMLFSVAATAATAATAKESVNEAAKEARKAAVAAKVGDLATAAAAEMAAAAAAAVAAPVASAVGLVLAVPRVCVAAVLAPSCSG